MRRGVIIFVLTMVILFFNKNSGFSANEEGLFGDTTFQIGSWQMELIPDDQVYPLYVADPRRPRMHIGLGAVNTDIPNTSEGIINLDVGTRLTLLKMQRGSESANEFSLDIEGGIFSQFDWINGLDNIGWDGRYGVYIASDWYDLFVARFGHRHISAHLGDEYIEETGRKRINYTRDDLRVGIGYRLTKSTLVYLEPSWAWHLGNSQLQNKWAIEGGIQYQGPYTLWKGSAGYYAGVHISSFEENNWDPNVACQVGVRIKRDPRRTKLRFGLEGYTGRAKLGEFALDFDETYITAGFFVDF